MLPKGVPLGGQKHGWHDTHYVEYMTSQIEHSQITGSRRSYLDHTNFHKTGIILKRFLTGKTFQNFPGFTIGSDAKEDGQVLVPCYFYMGDPPSLIDVPNGSAILHTWNQLHEEQKAYINTMFTVIDILVAELEHRPC